MHWPDRYVPLWGRSTYLYDEERPEGSSVSIEETVSALSELVEEGKVRAYGVSNESTYGVCEYARAAEKIGARMPASIQNSYSLLQRSFESDLAEACSPRHHCVGLLAYSALCGGLLSGKYRLGAEYPAGPNSRFIAFDDYMRRWHPRHASRSVLDAVDAYARIAGEAGLSPSQLAILWCRTRPFVASHGSVIVGGTSVAQLRENIDAFDIPQEVMDEDLERRINEVHMRCRDPSSSL